MDPHRRHVVSALAAALLVGCSWGAEPSEPDRGREREGRRRKPERRPAPAPEPAPAPRGDFRSPSTGTGPKVPYQRGVNRLAYTHQGQPRSAAVLVPTAHDGTKPLPLVVGLHGQGGDWQVMAKDNGWARTCEEQGWFGVFPNIGSRHDASPTDGDHDFVMDVVQTVLRDLPIDRRRIYGVGFSGGCKKTYRLAARESHLFSAIGVVGGKMGELEAASRDWDPRVTGAAPVSVLHIHGERDRKVPMDGSATPPDNRRFPPTLEGLEIWAKHDGCGEPTRPEPPEGAPGRVWSRRWEAPGGHVVQGLIDPELDHSWPHPWANGVIVAFLRGAPPR